MNPRFTPGVADFSFCLNKWRYKSMRDPAILAEVIAFGAQAYQVDFLLDHPGGAENLAEVVALAQSNGITLVGADYGPPSEERFQRQVTAAEVSGIRVVRHACGPFLGWQEPLPLQELERQLRNAAHLYEKAGLLYALENHQDYASDDLVRVFETIGSPNLGILLDTGNSIALLEHPLETASRLAPFVFGVHLKDYAVVSAEGGFHLVGVSLGEGIVENSAILAILREKAPHGNLPLLLENPIERCRIDFFTAAYLRHLGSRQLSELCIVADLIAQTKSKFPEGVLPVFEDPNLSPAEIQAAEIAHNRKAYQRLLSYL